MERITVKEKDKELHYTYEAIMNYHGVGFPAGVAFVFQAMRRAFPLLADGQGPFGCPVSDSRRTMVGEGARDILTVIYGFSGRESVARGLETACGIFRKYAAGAIAETGIVS